MLSRSPVTARRPAGFIEPCLPTPAHAVPDGPLWAHEIKHDGYRFIGRRDGDRVRLFTRRGHDWTDRVPAVAETLRSLPVTSATRTARRAGCARLWPAGARPGLYGFDLLELDGRDLPRRAA